MTCFFIIIYYFFFNESPKKDPNEIIVSIIPTIIPLLKENHSYEFVLEGYNIILVPIPPNIIESKYATK